MGSEYSIYKIIHHIDALKSRHPVSCHWFITHKCNHNCPRCANDKKLRQDYFNRNDEWDFDRACSVAKEMRDYGMKAIGISGGEPLVYSRFDDLIAVMLELGYDLGIISNGRNLKEVNLDQLKQFKWLRFSIAGMTDKTYIPLHGHNNKPDIWSIISDCLPKLKSDKNIVGTSFLIQPENYFEIPDFAIWAKDVGFDTCRFTACWTPDGDPYPEDMKSEIRELIKTAQRLSDDSFEVYSFAERMDIKPEKKYTHCYYADVNAFLSANGKLFHCCMIQNSALGYIGDLYKNTFSEIWEKRNFVDVSKCPVCWFDKKNEFMEYLMDDNPRHVNFI